MRSRSRLVIFGMTVLASCRGGDSGRGPSRAQDGAEVVTVSRAVVNPNRAPGYEGAPGQGPLTNLAHIVPGQTVGSLEGKSSVDGGEYHYTLPLRLPEGPGGLTPRWRCPTRAPPGTDR
jgi:hypothetical protein